MLLVIHTKHRPSGISLEHVEIIIAYELDLDSINLIPRNEFLDPIYLCTTPN